MLLKSKSCTKEVKKNLEHYAFESTEFCVKTTNIIAKTGNNKYLIFLTVTYLQFNFVVKLNNITDSFTKK